MNKQTRDELIRKMNTGNDAQQQTRIKALMESLQSLKICKSEHQAQNYLEGIVYLGTLQLSQDNGLVNELADRAANDKLFADLVAAVEKAGLLMFVSVIEISDDESADTGRELVSGDCLAQLLPKFTELEKLMVPKQTCLDKIKPALKQLLCFRQQDGLMLTTMFGGGGDTIAL